MRRWLDSARGVNIPNGWWLVAALGMGGGVLVAGLISVLAVRSGNSEEDYVSGFWQIGLVVHSGPVSDSIGKSYYCSGVFDQIGTAIEGELDCPVLGRSADVTGFVSFKRDAVGMSAQFQESTIEIVAEAVSAVQLVGSWEDSQAFSGRFVAVRGQLSTAP